MKDEKVRLELHEHRSFSSRPKRSLWRVVATILFTIVAMAMIVGPSGFGWIGFSLSSLDMSEDHTKDNMQFLEVSKSPSAFQLKHIYHHGMGDKFRRHRRLDITPEYVARNKAHFEALVQATTEKRDEVDEEDLESVYRQMDWPKVHEGKNPFDIKLPIRKAKQKGVVRRLKERHTPGFLDSYLEYAMRVKGKASVLNNIHLEWEDETEVEIPDVEDKDTVVSLATISSNAYVRFPQDDDEKKRSDWIDVGGWIPDEDNEDIDFGWADSGMRGHVFVSEDNKTVVIGIKGTSTAGLPGTGPDETVPDDKVNDNLLFSCCCARVGYLWTTVCDCYEKTYTCNQDCLEKELMRQDRYYQATLDLYRNVTALYPPENHTIWVTGHSLGGALASLLGRTYGLPVVAYEAPGEMLATKRLHLPQPPGLPKYRENIWHFGNTADPIYMGVCNGASSSCNVAGYAMETACHTGKQCVYDVVTDKGWRVNLLNHRIHTVIDEIILKYNKTAPCEEQPPCRDCFNWRFTSHDDDEDDEPFLPNPLKPRPKRPTSRRETGETGRGTSRSEGSRTQTISSSSSSNEDQTKPTTAGTTCSGTSTSAPEEPAPPKKCLERTWYGWCRKWGSDDEDQRASRRWN